MNGIEIKKEYGDDKSLDRDRKVAICEAVRAIEGGSGFLLISFKEDGGVEMLSSMREDEYLAVPGYLRDKVIPFMERKRG